MTAIWQLLFSAVWSAKSYIAAAFKLLLAVGGLLMTIGALVWPFVSSAEALESVVGRINEMNLMLAAMPVGATMQFVNRVLPLTEFLALWGFLLLIKIAAVLLRWLSSFIPGTLRG